MNRSGSFDDKGDIRDLIRKGPPTPHNPRTLMMPRLPPSFAKTLSGKMKGKSASTSEIKRYCSYDGHRDRALHKRSISNDSDESKSNNKERQNLFRNDRIRVAGIQHKHQTNAE
jgi:hypothetical protein